MNFSKAMERVLDLAYSGVLSEEDCKADPILLNERERQLGAILKLEELMQVLGIATN